MDEDAINELVNKHFFPMIGHGARMMGVDLPMDPDSDQFTIPLSHMPGDSTLQSDPLLCHACSGMSLKALRSDRGYLHSMKFEDLLRSAEDCPLCERIQFNMRNAVRFHVQRREQIDDPREALQLFAEYLVEQHDLHPTDPTPVILRIDRGGHSGSNEEFLVTGTIAIAPTMGIAWVPFWGRMILHDDDKESIRLIRPRGSDVEVLERLKEWLKVRLAEVPSWSDAAEEKPLPTRVLDLGDADAMEGDLRLVETDRQNGQYVALSYCWGGYADFRTLRDNYTERLEEIRFDQLPALFAHAVKVTRGLGIRYLWIDALCIIQEDAEDWHREAACMSDIYWNTTCRVAVNDSKSPLEGFFPPKDLMASIRVPNLEIGEEGNADWESASEESGSVDSLNAAQTEKSIEVDEREATRSDTSLEDTDALEADDTNTADDSLRTAIGGRQKSCGELAEGLNTGLRDGTQEAKETAAPDSDCNGVANQDEAVNAEDGLSSGWMHDVFARMERNMSGYAAKSPELEVEKKEPLKMYLTSARSYAVDVDRGHLNTRAWVLQERLLAPRTIHFTKEHIYCEDQDDLCGEDWVKRYFTWMSSIDKQSTCTQIELFPERKINSLHNLTKNMDSLWWSRGNYRQPESTIVADPWLRVCENFSNCNISFHTDRLAAIRGLIKKKQELQALSTSSDDDGEAPSSPSSTLSSSHEDRKDKTRNFLGMWEHNLHVELAWASHMRSKLKFLHDLKLPSWAWIAYDGRVSFTKESRAVSRYPGPVRLPPFPELKLLDADVADMTTTLPLESAASLTVQITMREIHALSADTTSFDPRGKSRDEVADSVPFFYHDHTGTDPVLLASISECREILDDAGSLVGFVSLDEERQVVGDLFCAHISTLRDEDMRAVHQELDKPGVTSVDMSPFQKPILAYAMVLARVEGVENEFRRLGLAEVNYEWMRGGTSSVIRLV
ncbi:hypothetical protein VPNG_01025 [Cytospora leucostoma]|uniref:Heterokaryon incompatibility domain-containing protein n=1 Tax=Cytospora leucostoma TaxID=1230097 RepID=A0A423XKR6_9PEZI|nr:hypothetical protein VPNG_01025 [Cytospora leucostoma]